VIHKKILDAADSDPDASMEEIADEIGGASTELVERVFEQYGDPAGDGQSSQDGEKTEGNADDATGGTGRDDPGDHDQSMDDGDSLNGTGPHASTQNGSGLDAGTTGPDVGTTGNGRGDESHPDLSEKELRALRLVERNPEASQGDIAEEFDVTRATISRWLNDIEGFEWRNRREHAPAILNGEGIPGATDEVGPEDESSGSEPSEDERLGELGRRLEAIERRLEDLSAERRMETGTRPTGIDPELAHKVVHACLNSDRISEEEELRLLKQLMA
jgi:transposase-like protein